MTSECKPPPGTPDGTVCVLLDAWGRECLWKWRTKYGPARWSLMKVTMSMTPARASGFRFHSIAEPPADA